MGPFGSKECGVAVRGAGVRGTGMRGGQEAGGKSEESASTSTSHTRKTNLRSVLADTATMPHHHRARHVEAATSLPRIEPSCLR